MPRTRTHSKLCTPPPVLLPDSCRRGERHTHQESSMLMLATLAALQTAVGCSAPAVVAGARAFVSAPPTSAAARWRQCAGASRSARPAARAPCQLLHTAWGATLGPSRLPGPVRSVVRALAESDTLLTDPAAPKHILLPSAAGSALNPQTLSPHPSNPPPLNPQPQT
jgi:hypothetical protein